MGKIELELKDWTDLRTDLLNEVKNGMQGFDKRVTAIESAHATCSSETNQRLDRIEGLLTKGKNVILKWAGKGFVIGYRALALYLLYRLTSVNPELATAAKNILLP